MIPTALLSAFLKKWWPAFALAALFGILLTLAYCNGRSAGKQGEVIKQQEREIAVQQDLGRANDNAARSRLESAVTAERQQKELTDALNATQDPDRQRVLRGCTILHQQGFDTDRIPECR